MFPESSRSNRGTTGPSSRAMRSDRRDAVNAPGLRIKSPNGRRVLAATVLGSGLASLDATVVNVALPTIGRDLGGGLSSLQWVVNAYTLTLAGFLLLGGALGDRYGRRRMFLTGITWFTLASALCALAPSAPVLIAFRALQGVGAALLAPGSLAILEATFSREDRATAIGAWAALGGMMSAVGPFVGGWLVESASWRLVFLVNLPFGLAAIWLGARYVPETRDEDAPPGMDIAGAALTAVALTGLVYALTEGPQRGWTAPIVLVCLVGGLASLVAFTVVEARSAHPLVPLEIFRNREFSATNLVTFVVYGALGGSLFLVPIELQRAVGFSPIASGAALLPLTLVMLVGSSRAGRLATRIGPRVPLTIGPIIAGCGVALLARIGPSSGYTSVVLPAVVLFGIGLALTVAPLTATVLAALPDRHAGVASAVNSDVARAAGLIAVAVLPVLAGIHSADLADPARLSHGFQHAMLIAAATLGAGGMLAWVTVRRPLVGPEEDRTRRSAGAFHCGLDAPVPVDVT